MAARFARPGLILVALVFAFASREAAAQTRAINNQAPAVLNALSPRDASSSYGQGYGTPNAYELARQPYGLGAPYGYSSYPSCNAQREAQLRRTAMMQTRRDNEATRRKAARERLRLSPKPILTTDEQQAASKFEIAHALWRAGKPLLARDRLDEILTKFPETKTAGTALLVLTRF